MYKLSDFKGDEAFEILAEISPVVFDIKDAIKKESENLFIIKDGKKIFDEKNFKKILPEIIKNNKDIAIKILAPLNRMSVEEYKLQLTLGKLIKDLIDLNKDEDLFSFFN